MKNSLLFILSFILFANVSFSQTNPISPKEALIQAQAELDDAISQLELAQNQRQNGWIALGFSAVAVVAGVITLTRGAFALSNGQMNVGEFLIIGGAGSAAASGGYLVFKSSQISQMKEHLRLDRENIIRLQKNL